MAENDKKQQVLVAMLEKMKNEDAVGKTRYVVPLIFSKRFASMALIREDIAFVQAAFERLLHFRAEREKGKGDEIIEASLFYAAISQYGRCFNSNFGGHSKLDPNDLFGEQDSAHMASHEMLMELRNSFIAHRDDTAHEQAIVLMQLDKASNEVDFRVNSAKTFSQQTDLIEGYIALCKFILPKIDVKVKSLSGKTLEGLLKNLEPKYINMLRIE